MRTLILTQAVIYALCASVVALLWLQNRRRFAGLGFWLADFAMQTMAMLLLALRDAVPGWMSISAGNALSIGGTILFYIGLERFVNQRRQQIHNAVLLVAFVAIHTFFAFVQPNLAVRNVNFSMALLLISFQCAWLMLRRVDTKMYTITRWTGFVFAVYCLVSLARIIVNLAAPPGNDFFRQNGMFDTLLILVYQTLFIAITFSLFLMINRRLFIELESQQQTLQESEARYRQLIELSPDAIVVYHDGNIVFVNSAAVTLMGAATQNDLLGKAVLQFIHPSYHAMAQKRIKDTLTIGEATPLTEEKLIRLDGATIDVELTTARLEYQDQPALQTIVRNITERKQTENVIRLRLGLLEYAADHSLTELMQHALDEIGRLTRSPIGFYHFVEADQKTLSLQAWSTHTLQEFCQTENRNLHYDIDQAGVWVDCVHQRQAVIHNDYAALPHRKGLPAGHAEVKRELVVPTMRDGRIVAVLGVGNKPVNYVKKDIELVAYVADVIWSIVERKRTEEQLQEYQRQLEAQNLELRTLSLAIEQSGSTVVITDSTGAIQYANPHFEKTSGYTVHNVLGQNPRMLKSGEQSADFYKVLWETITSGQVWCGEFRNRRQDGKLYWESATVAPVQDAAGQITHYIAVKEDITERKEAEKALRHYAEQLALQNAELDAFAHTVAHDLKNPLGIVIGYANFLQEAYTTMSPDALEQAIYRIARSSKKLNTIIEELLLLASVRKEQVSPAPLAMAEVLQGACERLQMVIQQTQAQISTPDPSTWPAALGYAPWVEEVWANYISNAIKYGGKPPRVQVGWDTPVKDVSTSFIRFWVHDNGPGLTPEAQTKLFTSFTRLGQVRVQGHGLGLSIVQRIVEKLGGEVGVESALEQGSRFYFTLPAAK